MRILVGCIIFFTLLLICGCGKNVKSMSGGDILKYKRWKRGMIDKNTATNPADMKAILYGAVPSCQQDDILTFNTDGTLSINGGVDKCSADEPLTKTVQYSYDDTNNELTIDGIKYKVAEMSSSQIKYYLVISYTATGYGYLLYMLQ